MKKVLITFALIISAVYYSFSQNGWTQIVDYPGSGSVHVAGFNFQGTGLAGLGYYNINTNNFADVWEYYPSTNNWLSQADFPGITRYNQSGFSLGRVAYICLGSDATTYFNDLWQYDGNSNSWVQKASFPGIARYGAVAIGVDNKAYVGLGQYYYNGTITDYFTDFYEYDQFTNTWAQKTDFPGQARYSAFTFYVDGKIYVVGGRSTDPPWVTWTYLRDMYAYDIATDTWTQKTSYPGAGSCMFGGFVLGQYAYMGTGYDGLSNFTDFWKYDPQTDSWLQLANFPGLARRASMYLSIGSTGYLGCGRGDTYDLHDFWKYEEPTSIEVNNDAVQIKLFPVPAGDQLCIEGRDIHFIDLYTADDQLIRHVDVSQLQDRISVDISGLAAGFYFAKISTGDYVIVRKVIKD
jgi:N-acetylneuraminic acid mutarotase